MGKGLGLLGNFNGKVGNTVGYAHKASKDKQTQGIRLHQPVVKNPKTYGQAEQRAKIAPINVTYSALKSIIDRGQEGKGYGNKSRLAWMKLALKQFNGGWFKRNSIVDVPALVYITQGSIIVNFEYRPAVPHFSIAYATQYDIYDYSIKAVSRKLIEKYPSLRVGDNITFVSIQKQGNSFHPIINTFTLNLEDSTSLAGEFGQYSTFLTHLPDVPDIVAGAVIVSRKTESGTILRSSAPLKATTTYPAALLTDDAKEAAIQSYMSADGSSNWEEDAQ